MVNGRPECRAHGDCFANEGGRCACLKDNDFGGRDCPFYKNRDVFRRENQENHGRRNGGAGK